jgi:hypothetical protein
MKRSDKILVWLGRIISLPMAAWCFYIVRQQWALINKGKALRSGACIMNLKTKSLILKS